MCVVSLLRALCAIHVLKVHVLLCVLLCVFFFVFFFFFFHFFFFNDTATTEIYTLSLHDALPIYSHEDLLSSRVDAQFYYRDTELAQGFTDLRGRNLRSEEHTSELQSLTNLVCRLLLEKKKKKQQHQKRKKRKRKRKRKQPR